jgi:hypothetical protein
MAFLNYILLATHARQPGQSGVAGEHPPASFHLVIDIHDAGEPSEPARELLLSFQGRRVHILAVTRDVPATGKNVARPRLRVVEYGLGGSRRVRRKWQRGVGSAVATLSRSFGR